MSNTLLTRETGGPAKPPGTEHCWFPAGGTSVPFFWLYNDDRERIVDAVRVHPSVERLEELDRFADRNLYALTWTDLGH